MEGGEGGTEERLWLDTFPVKGGRLLQKLYNSRQWKSSGHVPWGSSVGVAPICFRIMLLFSPPRLRSLVCVAMYMIP